MPKGTKQVVKVQLPLTGPSHLALIYDERRRHETQVRVPDAVYKIMSKRQGMKAYRCFFWATWNNNTKAWDFGEKPVVSNLGW